MAVRICVAGTFNKLHKGHLVLLAKAFEIGEEVYIGLTSDRMAGEGRNVDVLDYHSREQNLKEAIVRLPGTKPYRITEIDDELGPAATGDYDGIVVSSATEETAVIINESRNRNGLNPLEITVIDMVLGEDGKPISATRVAKGEVGPGGQCNNA